MTIDIVMPKLGESLQEGTIIKWLKKEGDKVERDEMILEISTDKVDTEVPSPSAGILTEILAKENETVEVGKVIAKLASGEEMASPAAQETKLSVAEEAVKLPKEETVEETTGEIPRKKDGRFYSPLVRSIAETENISAQELEKIAGSGADGRVTKKDVLDYLEKRKSTAVAQRQPSQIVKPPEAKPASPVSKAIYVPSSYGEDDEIIEMDRVRRLIAEHMVYSKHTSPHVTSVAEADVTKIVRLRKKIQNEFIEQEGFKLTYTPFFAKAVIDGVKAFPMVNVSVEGTNILRHRRINLSFATALEDGNLIVPVIKNADALGITGLARAVYDLSVRARSKKLNPDDIQGGTITITNIGTFGTLFGSPIINQPQAAIIGIGAVQKRPVVREIEGEDLIVIRDMVYISITYDHRVIDGMLAGQCLAAIVKSVEGISEI